jgi:signal transduction histidine kinase
LEKAVRNVTTKLVAATLEVSGGHGRFYEMRIQPYLTVDKKVDGAVLSLVDITDRKKLENEQKLRAESLEQKVSEQAKKLVDAERLSAIGATAGMVGHDIRNPLQAITGDLYLAKTDLASIPESEEKQAIQESLTAIENNVDYINKIVQDLQDYARPLNPKPEEADLKLIITKLFEKNNMPDNIELSVKVENSAEKISTDSYYINRIMFNLINNAVQAMPNGGKLIVHTFRGPKDIVMTVKDTGVGIPKDIQGKLFTPMFTTKSKGQGFGLPVVKRMAESLGGTVTFESQEGKGTTFTVRLPLTI